jgi:hypothetical protein
LRPKAGFSRFQTAQQRLPVNITIWRHWSTALCERSRATSRRLTKRRPTWGPSRMLIHSKGSEALKTRTASAAPIRVRAHCAYHAPP